MERFETSLFQGTSAFAEGGEGGGKLTLLDFLRGEERVGREGSEEGATMGEV